MSFNKKVFYCDHECKVIREPTTAHPWYHLQCDCHGLYFYPTRPQATDSAIRSSSELNNDRIDDQHRRLMDLLAGWTNYTSLCEENFSEGMHVGVSKEEYSREAEEISELYQLAGRLECARADEIVHFVENEIVPLLVRGPRKS